MNRPAVALLACMALFPMARDASALTREQVLEHAAAYAEHLWECSLDNTVLPANCDDEWICDWAPGTYVGLPYDWGGYKTIEEFDQDLVDGLGAGSHKWHGVLWCTTGLDCSGFVSQCWEAPHLSTSTMFVVAEEIDPDDILPADAYNKAGSHIVLWVGRADNGAPVFYEAAGNPVNKVRLNEGASWSYLSGYLPIRLSTLGDVPPLTEGTPDNPIEIHAFPFADDNNTILSPSKQWDAYSCAPDKREWGPEIVYHFFVAMGGDLTVSVTDPAGVDVDVHLLSAPDPDACLIRNDKTFTATLTGAGDYWIAADSWTDPQGTSYPGSYHLDVDFTAVPPADVELVKEALSDVPVEMGVAEDPIPDTVDVLITTTDPAYLPNGTGCAAAPVSATTPGLDSTLLIFFFALVFVRRREHGSSSFVIDNPATVTRNERTPE